MFLQRCNVQFLPYILTWVSLCQTGLPAAPLDGDFLAQVLYLPRQVQKELLAELAAPVGVPGLEPVANALIADSPHGAMDILWQLLGDLA